MLSNLEVIIGIENHVELKTKTKIFSNGPIEFGAKPNTKTNEIDLGYPGTMPIVNIEGVRLAVLAANSLHMKIDPLLRFDRKNYFYPDLAKGFQITQQFHPIGIDGYLDIKVNEKSKRINIERIHIEEDTAKQTHKDNLTLIDYNRSGIGLIEIVSCPDLRSADEAVAYITSLREILLFLGVSDVKMNEGSFRCDVNISVRTAGTSKFGNKVEIKNINTFANVKKAIEFEIIRQSELFFNNQEIKQETRRFDEDSQITIGMRTKVDAIDYRYFPEPNITPIQLDKNWLKNVILSSPELADQKRERFIRDFQLRIEDVNLLLSSLELTNFFEETLKYTTNYFRLINYLLGDIQSELNKNNYSINDVELTPQNLASMINFLDQKIISTKHAKTILPIIMNSSENSVKEIIEKLNLKLLSDSVIIEKFLSEIITDNSDLIKQYANRPERVLKIIMGVLMKKTQGNVDPVLAKEILQSIFKKISL